MDAEIPKNEIEMTTKQCAPALQKILLVDDDKSFIHLNRAMLKYNDVTCQIDECRNGQEALAYIRGANQLPDVILLDMDMPVMNGLEFLEKFEGYDSRDEQTKVFVLSSSTDQDKVRSKRYNFVKGYFQKPLTDSHIKQILALF
jgi:CheY-like chemotaxis protein